MQKFLITVGLVAALAGVAPADARAQVMITPYGGVTFGGDAPATNLTTGASLTFMGDVAGFEVDLGYTPDFFDEGGDEIVLIGDGNVTTFMGNLVLGPGEGVVRPYFVAGVGLARSRRDLGDLFDDVTTNEWALGIGGGVVGFLSDHVGLRGDVRYIRGLEDPEDDDNPDLQIGKFDFWRATIGVVFRP